jgi:[ribosomal protein S18]-alanine N-acetyltransferase
VGKKAEISIGVMRREDLDQVLAIEQVSFNQPWSLSLFEQELRKPALSTSFVACTGERGSRSVLGYLVFWVVAQEMHILNLAVAPAGRRKGIAKLLILSGLRYALAKGARMAFLEVRASNRPARNLYHGLGFVNSALRKSYYDSPPEDALVMTLPEDAFVQAASAGNKT